MSLVTDIHIETNIYSYQTLHAQNIQSTNILLLMTQISLISLSYMREKSMKTGMMIFHVTFV